MDTLDKVLLVAGDRYTEHTIHSRRNKHVGRLEGKSQQEKEKRERQVEKSLNILKQVSPQPE